MEGTLARQSRRFHEQLLSSPLPQPSFLQLFGFRMARTSIALEQPADRPDHAYFRERGWFGSEYYYPTRLGLLKRVAGAAFDRMAARSSKRREWRRQD